MANKRRSKMPDQRKPCALCNGPTRSGDLCFGCKNWICEKCSVNFNLSGFGHDASDHAIESEED